MSGRDQIALSWLLVWLGSLNPSLQIFLISEDEKLDLHEKQFWNMVFQKLPIESDTSYDHVSFHKWSQHHGTKEDIKQNFTA